MTHPTFSRRTGRKAALYLGSALLTLAAQSPVLAQTVTWQGGTSSDWQDGSNWSNGHVPANNTVVIAPSGGANNPVVDGGTATTGTIWLGSVDGANLTFQNGAQAESGTVTIGNRTNNGAVAGIHQETGTATATGIGTVWNTDSVTVGYYGKGTLNVSGGAVVSSANGLTIASMALNADATNTGTVSVSGAGSKLVTTQGMSVGADGKGDLNVSGGGRVESRSGSIGTNSGSNGTATFTGDDSFWNIVGSNLTVGQSGQGSLTISDGAGVQTSHRVSIGNSNGSTGKLTVTGAGSTLTSLATGSGDYIGIGINGTGELEVLDGAEATGIRTILGYTSGRSGTLKLDGANSLFHVADYAMIGMSGTGKATVSNGATLRADGVGGVLLGYGATGNGTLNIGAAAGDAATGAGTITAPKIQFGAGTGELVLNHNTANYQLTTPLVGAGTISVLAGDTTLSGDSTLFTGTTTIDGGIIRVTGTLGGATTVNNAGALYVGNGTKSGTLTGNIVNNGAVIFNPSGDSSYNGILSGTGSLSHIGTGTTRLTGNNSLYTGTASVTGGTLELAHLFGGAVTTGNGGTLKLSDGSFYNGSIVNNGATVFNRTSHYNYTGSLSGSGEITKQQSGILTLTGNSSAFTGTTTVAEGAVLLTGALGGSVAINSGAMFQAGNNSHSIGFNGNVLNNGAFLLNNSHGNYQHSFAGNISGNGTNTIHTTLGRTLILSGNSGAFTGTTYFTGGGTYLTGALGGAVVINADAGLAVGNGTVGGELLATDVTNNGLLYFWQPGQTTYAGSLSGNGAIVQTGGGKTILTGNGGAFTGTTTVQAGTIELTGTLGGSVSVSSGNSFIFNRATDYAHLGALSGAGNLYKEGANTLTLSADNSAFTGVTTVQAGTLQLMNALGGHIAIDSGAELSLLRAGDYNLSGGISGAGSFRKGQSGILTLSGDNSGFSGTTYVDSGTLALRGALSGNIAISNKGTLEYTENTTFSGNIANNGSLIFNRATSLSTYTGQISGTGALIKRQADQLALTGDSSGFTGTTTVESGILILANKLGGAATVNSGATLKLADGGAFGGDIANDGALLFAQSGNYSYGGALSGTGTLTKENAGTLTLSGNNSGFSGTTSVLAGGLLLTNALGGDAQVETDAALGFNMATDYAHLGTLSGTGNLVKLGTNKLTLSADNSGFTGVTTVQAGTLQLMNALGGYIVIDSGAELSLLRSGDYSLTGGIAGTGAFRKGQSGILTLTGSSNFTGTTYVDGGTLRLDTGLSGNAFISAKGTLEMAKGAYDGDIINNGTLILSRGDTLLTSHSGQISGTGAIIKRTAGSVALTGDNSGFTGTTTIEAGTLNVGNVLGGTAIVQNAATLAISNNAVFNGDIINNGTLAVSRTTDYSYGGVMSGAGELIKQRGGVLTLSGDNSGFSGTTTVRSGGLHLTNALGGAITVDAAGTLVFDQTADHVHSGILSGTGSLVKQGANKLILSADNSGFTGTTTVQAGLLQLMNALGGNMSVNTGGELSLLRAGDYEITGTLSGAGNLRKGQSGTATLSGDNSNFTGAAYVDGGALFLNGAFGGNAHISDKGTLHINTGSFGGDIANNGAVIFDNAGSHNYGGTLSGAGSLTKQQAGKLTLTADNSGFTGTTTIASGTLELTNALGGNIVNNGNLIFNRTGDYTLSGALTGNGTLRKQQAGLLTIGSHASGFSGITFIEAGTVLLTGAMGGDVSVNNGATLRLGSQFGGNIVNNGTLSFEQSGDNTYAGKLSGTGVIHKATTGILSYTGNGSGFTGTTHLDAGTLLLTGSLAGTVHINANGALRVGNGTTDGELLANAVNNGVLIFDQTGDYDYTGALSGNGGLVKRGNGTLLLSGNYSYTGTTQVEGGLVRLTSQLDTETDLKIDNGTFDLSNRTQEVSGLSGNSGTLALGSTGNLVVQQNENSTFGGSLSGGGTFTKAGEGNLNLTGNSTFTGEVNVNDGRLALNGTLPGQVNVNSGGALGGTGTAGQVTVRSGGTLAPGNSIGTLRVNGNVLFEAGSVYSVEVDAAGQSDRIDATGQARLQGGMVEVLAEEGNYRPQTDYTILTAVAGVQGTFTDVSSNFAYLTPRLIYSADRVVLSLSRNDVELGDIARTPNQIATAGAVTSAFSGTSDLYINMVGLSEDGARTAFDNLSGEVHPSSLSAAANHSESLRRTLTDRLDVSVEDGALMWIEAIGERGELEATSNTARVSGHNAGGVRLGIDTQREGVRFGVAAGFTDSSLNVHNRSSYADVKTAHIAAYAGARAGAVNLRGGISYSDLDFKTRRHVRIGDLSQQLTASYGGKATQLFGEAGYDLNLGGTTVEPFIGLNALWLNNDGFSENGGDLALTAREQTRERTWSTLGVKTQYSFGEVSPVTVNLKAGWQHALGKQSVTSDLAFANGQNFTVQGAPLAKDSALIDISLNWTLSPSANLGVGYTGTFADQGESQAVKIVVGARF